jgi:hypothetical protein
LQLKSFLRKGRSGDWKVYLNPQQEARFEAMFRKQAVERIEDRQEGKNREEQLPVTKNPHTTGLAPSLGLRAEHDGPVGEYPLEGITPETDSSGRWSLPQLHPPRKQTRRLLAT